MGGMHSSCIAQAASMCTSSGSGEFAVSKGDAHGICIAQAVSACTCLGSGEFTTFREGTHGSLWGCVPDMIRSLPCKVITLRVPLPLHEFPPAREKRGSCWQAVLATSGILWREGYGRMLSVQWCYITSSKNLEVMGCHIVFLLIPRAV